VNFFYSLLLVSVVLSCKSRVVKKELPDLRSVPDPMAANVHDSLKHLVPILDSVLISDQEYRWGIHLQPKAIQEKMQKAIKENEEKIKVTDKRNIKIVTEILDKYGFLGPKDIGMKGYFALVFTMQHADKDIQKRYLPLFYNAVQQEKLIPLHFAMLADRVAVLHGAPQMYGTQISFSRKSADVLPLLNPDSVEVWRKRVGMEPLGSYLKKINADWNIEDYKRKLPELKIKYKITDTSSIYYYGQVSN